MNLLERTFLDLALDKKFLTADQRDQVEAACARAAGEGQTLKPWRAAFVRGIMTRAEVDKLLSLASARVGQSGLHDTSHEAKELSSSAEDEGLDYRLGVLALQTGVINEGQLEEAIEAQRSRRNSGKKPRQLGEVLVEEGLLTPLILEGLVLLQDRLRANEGRESSSTEAIATDLRFGQVALDARLVSEKELARALAEQKKRATAKKRASSIGDVLVEIKAMTREARDLVLELQERRASRPAAPPPETRGEAHEHDKIGRILVDNRLVSEDQVRAALELQRELRGKGIDRRLGDLLVLQGAIDRPTLETMLRTQTVRRKQPVKRRRLFREDMLPEHPTTVLLALGLALILVFAYVAATDGSSLVLRAVLQASGDRGDPKKPR